MPRETPTQKLLKDYEAGMEIRLTGKGVVVHPDKRTDNDPKPWVTEEGKRHASSELRSYPMQHRAKTSDKLSGAVKQVYDSLYPQLADTIRLHDTRNETIRVLNNLFEVADLHPTPEEYRHSLNDQQGQSGISYMEAQFQPDKVVETLYRLRTEYDKQKVVGVYEGLGLTPPPVLVDIVPVDHLLLTEEERQERRQFLHNYVREHQT